MARQPVFGDFELDETAGRLRCGRSAPVVTAALTMSVGAALTTRTSAAGDAVSSAAFDASSWGHRVWSRRRRLHLAVDLALSLAASSIMVLMVVLGGEALARIPPGAATTPTDPDPERTTVATDALSLRFLEANAPGSVTLPCWLSDGPNDIVEPCRR
jgi:hypothetical protein